MTTPPAAGVFVVRAWQEGDHFRARITYSSNVICEPRVETEVRTAHPDDIHQHVTTWLQEITTES